ncbi:MAG: class I SAM-dependent methyltransferase [Candidatus Eisenbacteria bacterium]
MTYRPREFWEQRLSEQFDLRGTGETTMSAAYNAACYQLRAEVLDAALARAGVDVRGKRVLDVGCGTGFWTDYYVTRGAAYTGLDIARPSVERLRERYPQAAFVHSDVSEADLTATYEIVNVFDVLYHIVDDARFDAALGRLARAVEPGGLLLLTDLFQDSPGLAEHNKMRSLARYRRTLDALGVTFDYAPLEPTHVLLNSDLGFWRFLNRAPGLLLALDRMLLRSGGGRTPRHNQLLLARRTA